MHPAAHPAEPAVPATGVQLNPLLELVQVRRGEDVVEFAVVAPVRGRPLTVTRVHQEREPAVFALLAQLAARRGAIDLEFDDTLWARLMDTGILVREGEVARVVRLHCSPSDPPWSLVPRSARRPALPSGRLEVNPTLRYQGQPGAPEEGRGPRQTIVLRRRPTHAAEANPFAADCGWAWAEPVDSPLPCALSVGAREREALSRLVAGAPAPRGLDPELERALILADVLVVPEDQAQRRRAWDEARRRAAAQLGREHHAVLRGLVPPLLLAALRRYYRELIAEGHVGLDDPHVPLRYHAHNEPLGRWIHQRFTSLVSELAGQPMKPSYSFVSAYRAGATLPRHRDRPQCALTFSLLIDYQPEPAALSPWPLYLEAERDAPSSATPVDLGLGDGLLFRGTRLTHWREALPAGHASTSLLLHYVPLDFSGPLD